ncbi:hypothetical protein [Collimonas silvisoli]|uniref:hypothetical protein n=1 Tax=Collimonas silvisoli TaxID=2825884 RepID=UPI001B8AE21B|nr:hypothetical protein [Collimonas silvisoli]
MIIVKKRRIIKWLLFVVGFVALLFLLRRCIYLEPPFTVHGDKEILNKVHVNVYMFKYDSRSFLATVFLNGKSYAADNSKVDRFEIYANYDNKLFSHYSYDNIPRMVNDDQMTRNALFFCKKSSGLYLSNNSDRKCDAPREDEKMLPFEEEVKQELSENANPLHPKTKNEIDDFVNDLKNGFNEIKILH